MPIRCSTLSQGGEDFIMSSQCQDQGLTGLSLEIGFYVSFPGRKFGFVSEMDPEQQFEISPHTRRRVLIIRSPTEMSEQ